MYGIPEHCQPLSPAEEQVFQAQRIAFQMFVHIQHLTSLPALR